MENVALVTGASSGIGRELARLFAQGGQDVVLIARNRQKLEELAQQITNQHDVEARVIVQDLAVPDAAASIVEALEEDGIVVDVLVNNAGTQVYGRFDEADTEALLGMIAVNITALTHLTRLIIPAMKARGRGKILNLGSTASFSPSPLNAVYCATKAYVLSLSEGIAAELVSSGVTVTTLCPGATATSFVERHGLADVRYFKNTMSAERVARIGYRALTNGRHVVVAGLQNKLMVLALQLIAPLMRVLPPQALKWGGELLMGRTSS
jgi:hypothetical protein